MTSTDNALDGAIFPNINILDPCHPAVHSSNIATGANEISLFCAGWAQ